jgi:hypothetical protein
MTNPLIGRGWHFPPKLDERGMLALASDHQEIEQAIWIILSTAPGQRVMRPDFGCRIHELIFAPNNLATTGLAALYVREALGRWEPRIELEEVEAVPDEEEHNRLNIHIKYRLASTYSNRSLVYPFYLILEEAQSTERAVGG